MKKNKKHGFTLIELMIVVAIIGILAAVAIPAFINYMKRAKTSEATLNLKSIVEGAVSYYDTHNQRLPITADATPTAPPTAAGYTMDSTMDNQDNFGAEAWQQIGWKPHKDFYYQYTWMNEANDETSTTLTDGATIGTAQAIGNLDGDTTYSNFTRTVVKLSTGLAKPTEVVVSQELE